MRTFAINTLGCKVNQYESQQIRELLENFSFFPVKNEENPDLLIVNTCCITHIASAKSRQCIRKVQRANPDSVVVVTGCLPAGPGEELGDLKGNIHIVNDKSKLLENLEAIINTYSNEKSERRTNDLSLHNNCVEKDLSTKSRPWKLSGLTKYTGQTRAFLKVQDGCDGFCSYCIVPKIRNKITNKPLEKIITETNNLVYAGHSEIVLTGIFLGAYGQNTVRRKKWDVNQIDGLADMLDKVAQIDGLKRLRLSSLEPADVTDKLLDTMCKHDNIMPHLHLPLQSGSEAILRKMCRQYNAMDFIETIRKVNERLDRPAITTDIIVGFPGETEENFQETVEMAKKCGFAKMHVFSYSERKDTAAVNMHPKVNPEIIKDRSKRLRQLDAELSCEFRMQFVGEDVSAVIENTNPCKGRTERYFMVHFNAKNGTFKKGCILHGKLQNNGINADIGVE